MDIKLVDYADGVKGHFCLGRIHKVLGAPYYEYYFKGEWCSAGEVLTEERAKEIKFELEQE